MLEKQVDFTKYFLEREIFSFFHTVTCCTWKTFFEKNFQCNLLNRYLKIVAFTNFIQRNRDLKFLNLPFLVLRSICKPILMISQNIFSFNFLMEKVNSSTIWNIKRSLLCVVCKSGLLIERRSPLPNAWMYVERLSMLTHEFFQVRHHWVY